MTKFDFQNKVVVVTGGGSGLGFAMTRAFLQAGAQVVIAGRRAHKLEEACGVLRNELGNVGDRLHFVAVDLSTQKNVESLVEETLKRFDALDVFINNAGAWALTPILELEESVLTQHIDSILKSTIFGTKIAARNMKKGSVIVNMGSFAGIMPQRQASIYSCLKSAIHMFTRAVSVELAERGVRINCVIPGVIRTDMTSAYIDKNYSKMIPPISLQRMGEEQEVANAVLFLCSESASYITGTSLEVTGGKFTTQL